MLHIENETWVSYDGLNSNWEIIDLRNKYFTFVKNLQGDGYGICATFYYDECMKDNKDTNEQRSVAAMNVNEIECEENDNDDVSEEDSYVKYCQKINECEKYDASYARREDIDIDGDDKYLFNVIK